MGACLLVSSTDSAVVSNIGSVIPVSCITGMGIGTGTGTDMGSAGLTGAFYSQNRKNKCRTPSVKFYKR